jgi:hypothetical protein
LAAFSVPRANVVDDYNMPQQQTEMPIE